MENLNAEQIKKELEGLANFRTCPEYIKNALALITSQEQEKEKFGLLIYEIETEKRKLFEENKRLTEKSKNFEQAYDCMHSACLELSDKCDRLTKENERLVTALANYDRLTDVRIAEEYYTAEAYEELREENERLRTESERLKARTVEALTEFAESVKRYYSALPGATVGAAVRFYVDEKLKEALDKI